MVQVADFHPLFQKIPRDLRQVTAEYRPVRQPRFQEGQTESLGHRGGDHGPGPADQVLEPVARPQGQLELDSDLKLAGKPFPLLITGPLARILRTQSGGEPPLLPVDQGPEQELAQVLAADSPGGIEKQRNPA